MRPLRPKTGLSLEELKITNQIEIILSPVLLFPLNVSKSLSRLRSFEVK